MKWYSSSSQHYYSHLHPHMYNRRLKTSDFAVGTAAATRNLFQHAPARAYGITIHDPSSLVQMNFKALVILVVR
jgi:hypothetical protein